MSFILRGLNEACWKGYHKEGMKTMFGKEYPNCVKNKKKNKANEGIGEPEHDENEIRKYYKDRNQPVPTDEKGQPIVPASWKAKKAVQPTEPDSWSTSKGVVTKTPTGIIHKSRQLTPKPTLVKDLEEAFPRPYGKLNPYGTIKEPKAKIRTYTYERPDGSIATRYEVLDKYGHRVKGQGTEGFDDLENAKALLRSLNEQTATQTRPVATTQKMSVDKVKLAIQKLPKPEQDKMVIFVKKLLDKQFNITKEGQIYSTGGGAGEGQHWYKPRTVPNQHELENNNKSFNVQKTTARQFAKEIHELIKEYGQLAQARPTSPKLEDLRKNILELHKELQNLGYDYDPKSPTSIRPLTLDANKISKIKEDESSILNQKLTYQEYIDKAEALHFAFLAASKANDKKEMQRLQQARDKLDAIASKGLFLENLGTPYPGTYEQETLPYRTKGQKRTPAIAFESDYEQGDPNESPKEKLNRIIMLTMQYIVRDMDELLETFGRKKVLSAVMQAALNAEAGDGPEDIAFNAYEMLDPDESNYLKSQGLEEQLDEFELPSLTQLLNPSQQQAPETDKPVNIIVYGRMPQNMRGEQLWDALMEILPNEYPTLLSAQEKTAEISQYGGAVVAQRPLSKAQKIVKQFHVYGIRAKTETSEGVAEGVAGDPYAFGDDDYMDIIQGMIDDNRRNMSPSRKPRVLAATKRYIEKNGGVFDPDVFEYAYDQIVEFSRGIDESQGVAEGSINEFAPQRSGGSGDYLRALASAWYNDTFNTGSLQRGIKSQEDVERVLARGIVCADGKTRKYNIDYNGNFDGVVIFSDDYYEHSDASGELDNRTGRPWGPYDFIEFKGQELDEDVTEGQLNELDMFAPVTTFIKMTDGSYIQAEWRRSQGGAGFSDSASFIKFKPVAPNVARQLGLDNIKSQKTVGGYNTPTIAQGGEYQGSGPLTNRRFEVVDYNKPETMQNLPDEIKSELVKWVQKQGISEDQLDEKWSEKYKKSINCNNPKGFSQKAHCQGRNKK